MPVIGAGKPPLSSLFTGFFLAVSCHEDVGCKITFCTWYKQTCTLTHTHIHLYNTYIHMLSLHIHTYNTSEQAHTLSDSLAVPLPFTCCVINLSYRMAKVAVKVSSDLRKEIRRASALVYFSSVALSPFFPSLPPGFRP